MYTPCTRLCCLRPLSSFVTCPHVVIFSKVLHAGVKNRNLFKHIVVRKSTDPPLSDCSVSDSLHDSSKRNRARSPALKGDLAGMNECDVFMADLSLSLPPSLSLSLSLSGGVSL